MDRDELACRFLYILLAIVFILALFKPNLDCKPLIFFILIIFALDIIGMLIAILYLNLKEKKENKK